MNSHNLPGSNNRHTAGRAIDTYDRGFDGRNGEGTHENTDREEIRLRRSGGLTTTGYERDGFVVEDGNLDHMEQVPECPPEPPIIRTVGYALRERKVPQSLGEPGPKEDCTEEDEDSDYDKEDDEDDSDYTDDESDCCSDEDDWP